MSKLTDQQLDDLFFGHLRDLEKDPPNGSWPLLAKNVAKNNFLKFGWKHFNIFYVAAITTVVLSSVIYFVLSTSTPETSKQNQPGMITDSTNLEIINNTTPPETTGEKLPESTPEQKTQHKLPFQDSTIQVSDPLSEEHPNDSIIRPTAPVIDYTPELQIETDKKEEAPKPKKIITIVKRDTVRIKDTVKTERIRW